ncbi:MAG TPA: ATP-binding domain-containing protein [Mycobacteriales bacterium]|nr:ATP-binding domain-containing protein [Mycobacteriales bacterium]
MCAGVEELEREQAHLVFARRCLEQMRDAVRSLEAHGGDPVSTEFLKAELFRRAQALLDDPETPLFFGRIDRVAGEQFYLGRRHVRDTKGDPVVIDWRAEVSRAFYRASANDPMGLGLRRRFGFSHGLMTSLEDEHLDRGESHDPSQSGILTAEIERPRVGPMRDIVATIQPDQDDLVRADLSQTICIQGAPGTGKTAVGLHRAAYLLYAYRDQLKRSGVLVVGPNRSFLGYIGALLPALGELDVEQVAVQDVVRGISIRAVDDAEVARLKGDERMAEVVRRAVYAGVTLPREDLMVSAFGRRWRVPRHELVELLDRERRLKTPYAVARSRLASLVAEVVRRRAEAGGGAPDDRAVARLAKTPDIKGWVDEHWPPVTAKGVVTRLLCDRQVLAECGADLLTDDEQQLLLRDPPPTTPGAMRWSVADAFLVDEVAGLLDRTPTFGHVVVDEAQDLSAMQCRALARRCPSGSATVLGDLAQATAEGAVADWDRTLALLGQADGRTVPLTRGYRVPAEVLDFANRLLPVLGVTVAPATSLRAAAGSLRVRETGDVATAVVTAVRELTELAGSIGVIASESTLGGVRKSLRASGVDVDIVEHGMEARVTLVPVTLCKGLEFDHVIAVEPAHIVRVHARGFNWLYVALTRAVTTLTVVHAEPLPAELSVA